MTWTSERLARAALTAAAEPGVMAKRLVEMTAEELWQHMLTDSGERWHKRAKSLDVDQLVERSEKAAMRFLIPGDEEWPTGLDSLARVGHLWGCWLRGLLTSLISLSGRWPLWDAGLLAAMVKTLP